MIKISLRELFFSFNEKHPTGYTVALKESECLVISKTVASQCRMSKSCDTFAAPMALRGGPWHSGDILSGRF